MAQNPIPTGAKPTSNLAGKMATGITNTGPSVPVTVITAPQMSANRTTFNDAETGFNATRKGLKGSYTTFHTAEDDLTKWLGTSRAVLTTSFGQRWSADWAAAGYVNHSTAVPGQIGERIGLANNLVEFLTANPSYEVSDLDFTAAYGSGVYDSAVAGQNGVATAERAMKDGDSARANARRTLVDGMRGLIKNLEAKLAPNDSRWLQFGLQIPATHVTPTKPQGLILTLSGNDSIQAICAATPLAKRYRWRMRVVGPGYTFQLVASTTEPLAIIAPVPPGVMVEIIVQAVNGNLQSVSSDPVAIEMPLLATVAKEAPATETLPVAPAAQVTNGHRNGQIEKAPASARR